MSGEGWVVRGEQWAVSTQMSSWTCFRISQRAISRTSPRTDAETSSAWQKYRKMSREKVGTLRAASEVFYSRKSRQSRQRLRVKFCEIREIITLVLSSDAARNVPTPSPLITHFSFLITHYSKLCSFVLLSKNLRTHNSQLIAHRSQLATENCIYSLQNHEFAIR